MDNFNFEVVGRRRGLQFDRCVSTDGVSACTHFVKVEQRTEGPTPKKKSRGKFKKNFFCYIYFIFECALLNS